MKPIYLEFQAFGPYLKKQKIDFSSLYENKLFLISGPTGSGKTTIFDALFYALYDKPLGYRSSAKIKSDFANFEECYVKLEFSSKGKNYTIIRTPKQRLLKGKKVVERDSKVELHTEEKIITKKIEVRKLIEDIVGFDADQFSKLLIIPQGEAHKLLFSSSDEKEKLFRTLFGTLKYKNLQNKLKEKSDEYKKIKEGSENVISRFLKSLKEYEKIKEHVEIGKYQLALDTLNEIQSENTNKISYYDDKLAKLNIEKITFQKESSLAEEYKLYFNKYEELNSDLSFSKRIRKENRLFDKYNYVSVLSDDIKNLEEKIENNKLALEDSSERKKNVKEQLGETQSDLVKLSKIHNKRNNFVILLDLKKRLLAIDKSIESLIEEKNEIEKVLDTLENTTSKVSEYEELKEKISLFDKLISIEKSIFETDEKLKSAMVSKEKYVDLEDEYRKNILSEIAFNLVEGDECPLCGSIHHPKLITVDFEYEHSDYRSELIKLERKISSYNTKISSLSDEFSRLTEIKIGTSELEQHKLKKLSIEIEDNLDEFKDEYFDGEISSLKLISNISGKKERMKNIKSKREELEEEREEILSDIKNLKLEEVYMDLSTENIKKLIDENDRDWFNCKSRESDLTKDIKVLENSLVSLTRDSASLSSEINKKNSSLEKYLLENHLEQFDVSNIISEDKYEENLKWLEEYDKNKLIIENKLDNLKDYSNIDIKGIKGKISDLEEKIVELNKEYDDIKSKSSVLKHSINAVTSELPKYISSKEDYEIYSQLFHVAEGKNSSNISFERFVLSMHLEDVLLYANKRLDEISSGRYRFRRKMNAVGGNRKEGLDIDIMDSNTKKMRDVKTLSGGEQFKAALCLALGISDYVSSSNSESNISILLIDEGFGTLSSDHLNSVINLISNIKKSGVLVGIISHVEELKDYIDAKINIVKDIDGSKINLSI